MERQDPRPFIQGNYDEKSGTWQKALQTESPSVYCKELQKLGSQFCFYDLTNG
jgi:hypothetical protein